MGGCAAVALPPSPQPSPSRERRKTPRRLPLPELAGILSFAAGYATVSSGGGLVQVILVIHGGRLRRRCSSALTPTLSLAGEGEDHAPPPSLGAGGHSFLRRWLCNCLQWGRASPSSPCNPRWAAAPPLLFRPHPNPLPRGRGGRPRAASLSRSGGHSFLRRWLCNCLQWGRASPSSPCNPWRAVRFRGGWRPGRRLWWCGG